MLTSTTSALETSRVDAFRGARARTNRFVFFEPPASSSFVASCRHPSHAHERVGRVTSFHAFKANARQLKKCTRLKMKITKTLISTYKVEFGTRRRNAAARRVTDRSTTTGARARAHTHRRASRFANAEERDFVALCVRYTRVGSVVRSSRDEQPRSWARIHSSFLKFE